LGDARYKWPLGMQERLVAKFLPPDVKVRAPPRSYKTPPYVTATPEVTSLSYASPSSDQSPLPQSQSATTHSISLKPAASPYSSATSNRRFIVLATDGLYDRLSSEEVVALVGGWLNGMQGKHTSQATLAVLSPHTTKNEIDTVHRPVEIARDERKARFTFEDKNLSTHLIRNALGGAETEQVKTLLSIPAPYSRRYRDDITVTVILLGDAKDETGSPGGVKKVESVRAKL